MREVVLVNGYDFRSEELRVRTIFLARKKEANPASRHLYMLDESSLTSTTEGRVLVIGDTRQHQRVDAGRPFQQMQEAGMQISRLNTIMRQKDPELLRRAGPCHQ